MAPFCFFSAALEPKRYIQHELSFYSVVGSKLVVGEGTTKLFCPQADRLVRDNDPGPASMSSITRRRKSKTERKPYRVGNNFSRKAAG